MIETGMYTTLQHQFRQITGQSTCVVTADYREYAPPACLRPFVVCFWESRVTTGLVGIQHFQVRPDGCMDLLWVRSPQQVDGYFVGIQDQLLPASRRAGEVTWGVRFYPWVVAGLMRDDMRHYTNHRVDLSECAPFIKQMQSLVQEYTDFQLAMASLVPILSAQFSAAGTSHPALMRAIRHILFRHGITTVAQTASQAAVGERHLVRLFTDGIGLSPKTFMAFVRFSHTMQKMKTSPGHDTSLILDGGYCDQPHFIRECRRFYGVSPSMIKTTI